MTLPNKITYSRILLVPIFAVAALQIQTTPAFKYVAVALFAVIAVGDAIDGYLAVKLNQSTLEGKFIDPLADKLLMVTACVFLALPIWGLAERRAPLSSEVALIIVARDVIISIWVVLGVITGVKTAWEPSRLGRLTTFSQMLMLGMMLLGTIWLSVLDYVARPLSYVAAALTIISGVHYLHKHGKHITFHMKDDA